MTKPARIAHLPRRIDRYSGTANGSGRTLCGAIRATPGFAFPVTLSLGIACTPHDGTTADELHGAADGALYVAKRRGGDQAVESRSLAQLCSSD